MGYFPFFMDISGKQGVVVGGGVVAARKVEKLLEFSPNLTVIATKIETCMWAQRSRLETEKINMLIFREKPFQEEDLIEADFVIAATDDKKINSRVSDYCRTRQIPVNVVDDKEKCTFFFPALVKDGALTIGISTDGKSPLVSAWVRKNIEQVLPKGLGEIIDLLGALRSDVIASGKEEAIRKEILEKMFLYCLEKNCEVEGKVTLEELRSLFIEHEYN